MNHLKCFFFSLRFFVHPSPPLQFLNQVTDIHWILYNCIMDVQTRGLGIAQAPFNLGSWSDILIWYCTFEKYIFLVTSLYGDKIILATGCISLESKSNILERWHKTTASKNFRVSEKYRGRKRMWPNLRYYSGISLEGHSEAVIGWLLGHDLNLGSHSYWAGVLLTWEWHLVKEFFLRSWWLLSLTW